jgi:predicted CopG family antitoxin
MPTITLRVTDQEHRYLTAMAEWKGVSLSDLVREYSRNGVVQDAQNTHVGEEIDKEVEKTHERLKSIGAILEEAAVAPLSGPLREPRKAKAK